MGYTTDFEGKFDLDKPLSPEHREYLAQFRNTRRMKRDAGKAESLPDPVREAAGLPVGLYGAYFVGGVGYKGQDKDESVIDSNTPTDGQPALWCQWAPNEDGTAIEWDGGEKFYCYTEWLEYLIKHFLEPWGYTLNGKVDWDGEDRSDIGTIRVRDNVVSTSVGHISIEYDIDEARRNPDAMLECPSCGHNFWRPV